MQPGERPRVVVVTGAGAGIGACAAQKLHGLGYALALLDVDAEALVRVQSSISNGPDVVTKLVDVRDSQQVDGVFQEIAASFGAIDVLINNVGGNTTQRSVETITDEEFHDVFRLNLDSAFYCTRAAVPIMKRQARGRIINLSSIAGRTTTLFSNAAYTAAKAAVIGFTRQCAAELAPHGIAVNAVAHGVIETERIRANWSNKDESSQEEVLRRIPAGRLGTVAEAASVLCYLCAEDAGYLAGAIIDVNGGLFIG